MRFYDIREPPWTHSWQQATWIAFNDHSKHIDEIVDYLDATLSTVDKHEAMRK